MTEKYILLLVNQLLSIIMQKKSIIFLTLQNFIIYVCISFYLLINIQYVYKSRNMNSLLVSDLGLSLPRVL